MNWFLEAVDNRPIIHGCIGRLTYALKLEKSMCRGLVWDDVDARLTMRR
jgi:hypothetical protein